MPDDHISELYTEINSVKERCVKLETQMDDIKDDVVEIKGDVKCLDKKMTENFYNDVKTKIRVRYADWFWKAFITAILGAMATKFFRLW